MKKTSFFLLLFLVAIFSAKACDISFKVEKEKAAYSVGDEIVVKVTIVIIHRDCPVNIKNTQFTPVNLKILQGTDWKEVTKGTWERKLKLKVLETTQKEASITAVRTCQREGGREILKFKLK